MRGYDGVPDDPTTPIWFARVAAAARAAPARRVLRRHAAQRPPSCATRARVPTASTPPRTSSAATSPPSAPPRSATWPPGPAPRRPTSPTRWERVETVSYRDEQGRKLLDLPGPAAPARRHPAPAAAARPLGPGAARLPGPRADHPARGGAAEAHAQRLPHRDRRRPRGRELGSPARGRRRDLTIEPHVEIAAKGARARSATEAKRTARICEPGASATTSPSSARPRRPRRRAARARARAARPPPRRRA